MNSTYKIEFTKKSLKFISKQNVKTQARIKEVLQILSIDPYHAENVKVLKGHFGEYRLRVGDIRIIYDIYDDILVISILNIGYRGDIYK